MLCPVCGRGNLAPTDAESIVAEETRKSLSFRAHESWEPEWIHGHFHGVLRCEREACKEIVLIVGEFGIGMKDNDEGRWNGDYENLLRPRFFIPPLSLIAENEKYPKSILNLVSSASTVLWTDPSSAANRIRLAIEELLTLKRVPKSYLDKKGKRQRSSLHCRIDEFAKLEPKWADTAKILKAVKHIGNDGSHGDHVDAGDVLDGVELLNHALELIYDTSAANLKRRPRRSTSARAWRVRQTERLRRRVSPTAMLNWLPGARSKNKGYAGDNSMTSRTWLPDLKPIHHSIPHLLE
jgi:hypothetical protein